MSPSLVSGLGWQLGDALRLELLHKTEEEVLDGGGSIPKLTVFARKEFQVSVKNTYSKWCVVVS